MNEKNIVGHSYIAALEGVMKKLKERTPTLGKKHIIIVPDRCTLTAERMLCASEGGSFDAFVTTWSRLFSVNAPQTSYLPRQGSIMIVRDILDGSKELECYGKSRLTRGFAEKLYDTISQLSVCDVPPSDVKLKKGNAKAQDIAYVYREYLRRTEGKYADAAGRMRLLKKYLEQFDYLSGATVYIACFDAYTKQMTNIIEVMREKAEAVYIFDAEPTEYSFGDVEIYAASSRVFAAKAIAAEIAYRAKEGTPYEEMCVVTAEENPAALKRILGENGIPYSAPTSLRLSDHPLGRFINLVLSLPVRGYRADDVVRLTKNPFCGVSKEDADAFERYVGEFAITYKLFLSPFAINADADPKSEEGRIYARAERARRQVATLVGLVGEFSFDGLRKIADYAKERYDDDVRAADEARTNPFDKMYALIDLCETLMSGATVRTVSDALTDAMTTTNLASRPKLQGVVEIGSERDFRGRAFTHVIVADFNSDTHPITTSDSGLLSDDDIAEMRENGTPLSPTTSEVNKRAQTEFYLLLESAKRITLVHTGKEGACLGFIRVRSKSFAARGTEKDRSELARARQPKDIMRYCPTENMLVEEYLSVREQVESEIEEPGFYALAKEAVGGKASAFGIPAYPTEVKEAGEIMLRSSTKVSQLESYFSCPMKHFLKYGLKLEEVRTADMNPADVGNVLHAVAEKYVKIMDEKDPETAAKELLSEVVAESGKGKLELNKRVVQSLTAEAVGMCKAINSQIKAGTFKPLATELEFGGADGVELTVMGKKITLGGRIDRVDVSGNLARVIDYKTGSSSFDLTELKCGVKIQLLAYLAVMIKAGYRGVGTFYFKTLADFGDKDPYVLDGLCANEAEVLAAMDSNLPQTRTSKVLKLSGSKKLTVGKGESEKDINSLVDYALKLAARGAEEIMSGYIAPDPAEVGQKNACRFCEYKTVCGFDGEPRKIRTAVLGARKEQI